MIFEICKGWWLKRGFLQYFDWPLLKIKIGVFVVMIGDF